METKENRVTVQMDEHDEPIVKLMLYENLNILISCCLKKIAMWTLTGINILTKVVLIKLFLEYS